MLGGNQTEYHVIFIEYANRERHQREDKYGNPHSHNAKSQGTLITKLERSIRGLAVSIHEFIHTYFNLYKQLNGFVHQAINVYVFLKQITDEYISAVSKTWPQGKFGYSPDFINKF